MAAERDENLFALPWNDSDLVLVVEETELNVHRWILTSQSPVFKALLEGKFREASQDKITLEEKNYQSMVQFLKILYPSYMFEGSKASLDGDNLLSILALADEYQCINLIKHCIDEAKITPGNVLKILPYAIKYHQPAISKLFDVLKWGTPTAKLEELLPKLDSKEAKDASIKMLLTKCRFLESTVVNQQDAMISLMCDCLKFLWQSTKKSGGYGSYRGSVSDSRCGHTITVENISNTKSCVHCREKYKENFIVPIPSCSNKPTESFIKMLHEGHDIVTAVKEQK